MRAALSQCVQERGYASLMLPANYSPPGKEINTGTVKSQQNTRPLSVGDCSMAIIDLNDYAHGRAPLPHNLEAVSDLPTVFLDSPLPKKSIELIGWNRQVARKIAFMDAENQYGPSPADAPIWLLMGSVGGPEAVSQFIDALPAECPVGFLYGQHITPGFEDHLVSMLDGRNGFQAAIAATGQRLTKGQIAIAPTNQALSLIEEDVLLVDSQPWPGEFQPSLEALAVEFSRRQKKVSGVIVFSGMGKDGSAALRLYASTGGRVWVQDPQSCVVSSMPEATLSSECVEYCASPTQLANNLAALYAS